MGKSGCRIFLCHLLVKLGIVNQISSFLLLFRRKHNALPPFLKLNGRWSLPYVPSWFYYFSECDIDIAKSGMYDCSSLSVRFPLYEAKLTQSVKYLKIYITEHSNFMKSFFLSKLYPVRSLSTNFVYYYFLLLLFIK